MTNYQILIIAIITITTIITITVGVQLVFLLKDLRKTLKKANYLIDFHKEKNLNQKTIFERKRRNIYEILNKINILSLSLKRDKKSVDLKKKM